MGRHKKVSPKERAEQYARRGFFKRKFIVQHARPVFEAVRWAFEAVVKGDDPLPGYLSKALLRYRRSEVRRMDEIVIANAVCKAAGEGAKLSTGEGAFLSVAKRFHKSPKAVEHIWRKREKGNPEKLHKV